MSSSTKTTVSASPSQKPSSSSRSIEKTTTASKTTSSEPVPSKTATTTDKFGFPVCTAKISTPAVDSNGYQYGYDNNLKKSCKFWSCQQKAYLLGIVDAPPIKNKRTAPTEKFGFPLCEDPVDDPAIDPNGYQVSLSTF